MPSLNTHNSATTSQTILKPHLNGVSAHSNNNTTSKALPTISQVSTFIHDLFPVRNGDVSFAFHSPRIRSGGPQALSSSTSSSPPSFTFLDPLRNRDVASHVVLSITPTSGFYHAMNFDLPQQTSASSSSSNHNKRSQRTSPLAFLHRPWALDRRSMPRRATVLSSHKGFDEVLTVGNNAALAARLGMKVDQCAVIQGYKGDPDRTIGIVGVIVGIGEGGGEYVPSASARMPGVSRDKILEMLEDEFGSFEGVYGFASRDTTAAATTAGTVTAAPSAAARDPVSSAGNGIPDDDSKPASSNTQVQTPRFDDDDEMRHVTSSHGNSPTTTSTTPIRVIAIMNAFHPAEVEQVEVLARSLITSTISSSSCTSPQSSFSSSSSSDPASSSDTTIPSSTDNTGQEDHHHRKDQEPSSCEDVLYLTGAVREPGLQAARERGMAVVCVGHRTCEEWGIRYMAESLRRKWPALRVDEILEDEA